jgi:hypothetical protein
MPHWYNNSKIFEPRIFELVEIGTVHQIMSDDVYRHRSPTSRFSGDHCNLLRPERVYKLVAIQESILVESTSSSGESTSSSGESTSSSGESTSSSGGKLIRSSSGGKLIRSSSGGKLNRTVKKQKRINHNKSKKHK